MTARDEDAPEAAIQSPRHSESPGTSQPAVVKAESVPNVPDARVLAKRVRASKALTGQQKRYWLAVLPHLLPEDRARLDAILTDARA
ncbi:MAG TPA: hypothetical protein VGW38_06305 [Chloroflexota bacterium]|nr:hypothetical protein [Chloroflexota bacterium]